METTEKEEVKYTLHKPEGYQKVALPGLTKWVQALRSGNYQQGTGSLHENGQYCCLGVLCETQGRLVGGSDGGETRTRLHVKNPLYATLSGCGSLPYVITVSISGGHHYRQLTYLNDTLHLTFPQIADILEEVYFEP